LAERAEEKSGGVEESVIKGRRRESVGGFDASRKGWEGGKWKGKDGDVGVHVERKVPVEERGISRSGDETNGEVALMG
jgi:hypothetical protein